LRGLKKAGEDDPALVEEIGRQKLELEEKNDALLQELQTYWKAWDELTDCERTGQSIPGNDRKQALEKMLDVLNRRNYIRNLVRDVSEVLEN
jgi:molecular chaperone HscB